MENNNTGFRAKIQKFGGVLSGMVMPNIGAFITWGLITAIFLHRMASECTYCKID